MIKSITQLSKEGYSRTDLYAIAHSKNSPAFFTSGKGKIMFDEDELKKFLRERRRA